MLRRPSTAVLFSAAVAGLFAFITAPSAEESTPSFIERGDAQRGRLVAERLCSACHGIDGNSEPMPAAAKLAGQVSGYTVHQIYKFRRTERRHPIMQPVAQALTREEILDSAAWYEQQVPKPGEARAEAAVIAAGRQLTLVGELTKGVMACTWCHGPNLQGLAPIFPKITGQPAAYTLEALNAFKKYAHIDPYANVMKAVANTIGEAEAKAIAAYLESQP